MEEKIGKYYEVSKVALPYAELFLMAYIPKLERDLWRCNDEINRHLLEQELKQLRKDLEYILSIKGEEEIQEI